MLLVYSVVARVEGVLDDEADYLRREVGEMRGERCGEGVEVVALVAAEAARGDHFLEVRVGRVRGEGGAGAEEDRDEAAAGLRVNVTCVAQGRAPRIVLRVDRGAVSEEQ